MRLKKLFHLDTFTKIDPKFCCEISEDSCFSVILKGSIEIFQLKPNLKSRNEQFNYSRTVLYPSLTFPTEDPNFKMGVYRDLPKYDVFELVYNPILAPRVPKLADFSVSFQKALWSPSGLFTTNACVLALLTNAGGLTLWRAKTLKWEMIADISSLILTHLVAINAIRNTTSDPETYLDEANERCKVLLTTGMAWSEVYCVSGRKFAFLVTSQRDGRICIWKISSKKNVNEIIVNFENSLNSRVKDITLMSWKRINEEALLVMGNSFGVIKCVKIKVDNSSLDFSSVKKCVLWPDVDKLKVTASLCVTSEKYDYIVASKGSYLIVFTINKDCTLLWTSHHKLGGLPITAINNYINSTFIVSVETGLLYEVTLTKNTEDFGVFNVNLIESDIDYKKWALYGSCVSRSAICISCLKPYKICSKKDENSHSIIVFSQFEHVNPLDVLLLNPTECLTDYWEYVEILRITALKDKRVMCEWPIEYSDTMSMYQTKVCYWLLKIVNIENENPLQNKELEKIKQKIIFNHIKDKLHTFSKRKILDTIERQSVKAYVEYLKNEKLDTLDDVDLLIEMNSKHLDPSIEFSNFCDWCDASVSGLKCSSGHPQQICSVSLLKMPDQNSYWCQLCEIGAHPDLLKDRVLCPFCDNVFQESSLLVDTDE